MFENTKLMILFVLMKHP